MAGVSDLGKRLLTTWCVPESVLGCHAKPPVLFTIKKSLNMARSIDSELSWSHPDFIP